MDFTGLKRQMMKANPPSNLRQLARFGRFFTFVD